MQTKAENTLKELLEVLSEEDLIRFAWRLRRKGYKETATLLKTLAKEREHGS